MASSPNPDAPRRALTLDSLEMLVGMGLMLCALALHVRFFLHAGGLWRDEVQIVNLANTSPLSRWWELNEHDTFPVVWQALVRLWTALGPGQGDAGLRALGTAVGLATLGALFFATRRLGGRVPLLGLALFTLSPTLIRYGDSLRGYGAGALAMLLMIGAVAHMALTPGRRALVSGLCLALLGVHTMHFNAAVLLGLGVAALALSLLRRAARPAATVFAVGAGAAVSLLPYADPILRQRRWSEVVVRTHPDLNLYLERFTLAANESGQGMVWIWLALLCLALGACAYRGLAKRPKGEDRAQAVFVGTMMVAGVAAYVAFLFASKLPAMPWYYIALMGMLVVAFDASFALFVEGAGVRARRIALVSRMLLSVFIAAAVMPRSWRAAQVRMTRVDLAATALLQQAGPQDLIVVCPFWYGITFQRYYRGAAPVVTVPSVPELSVQRFDHVREEMNKPDPLGPVFARITQTLRAGHRVFALGDLLALRDGELPAELPPGTRYAAIYTVIWTQQVSHLLQSHGAQIVNIPLTDEDRTFEYERPNLLRVQGWR